MAKSDKPTLIHEAEFKESGLDRHDKQVLLDYQVPTRLEEIEKLAEAVNKALPDPGLAFSANLCLEELILDVQVFKLRNTARKRVS